MFGGRLGLSRSLRGWPQKVSRTDTGTQTYQSKKKGEDLAHDQNGSTMSATC
jgi:hypothetical protein